MENFFSYVKVHLIIAVCTFFITIDLVIIIMVKAEGWSGLIKIIKKILKEGMNP